MKIIRFIFKFFNNLRRFLHLILLLFIFSFLLLGLAEQGVRIPASAALVVAPSGVLVEQLEGKPLDRAIAEASGDGVQQTLVKDVTDSLTAAIEDERIKAVVLALDDLQGGGLSKLQTIAAAIDKVRDSGKRVIAIGDNFTQQQYYLAAHADEIYMHEFGALIIEGFGYYRIYLKDVIEKLKIDLNVFRVGKYKSFVEPYIRNDMSDEDRAASERWLGSLWSVYKRDIEAARGLEPDSVDSYANNFPALLRAANGDLAKTALDAGFVDHVGGRHAVRQELIDLVGESDDEAGTYNSIHFQTYLRGIRMAQGPKINAENVGVLVASGEIVDGEAGLGSIGGDTLAQLVKQSANDDSIKALVLRVDSPGGSMFASEVVFEQLQQLKKNGKPLIVSMSSVAASGGYYIAMLADQIWASESTITGSIGVGALIPTFNRTLASLGINVDGFGTTQLSGQFRPDRELGEDARQLLQMTIDDAYRVFVGKVAEERGMTVVRAGELAEGRVWIGTDALDLGLVDELGGLAPAIAAAAEKAGLAEGEYGVKYVEKPLAFHERLILEFAVKTTNLVSALSNRVGSNASNLLTRFLGSVEVEIDQLAKLNDPRGLYYHCFCQLP
jgi:protease-4